MVIDGFTEENGLASPLPKWKLGPPNTEGRILQDTEKNVPLTKEEYFWLGRGVYTMENKDKNTDYQNVVRVGNLSQNHFLLV